MEFTFSGSSTVGLQVTRAHRTLTDQLIALEHSLDKTNPGKSAEILMRTLWSFESFSVKDRERLLQGSLTQTEGDHAVAEWVASCYDDLARLARRAVPENIDFATVKPSEIAEALSLALLITGYATKWRKIAGLRPNLATPKQLHQLYRFAHKTQVDATKIGRAHV